jgi:hypothetical protein
VVQGALGGAFDCTSAACTHSVAARVFHSNMSWAALSGLEIFQACCRFAVGILAR